MLHLPATAREFGIKLPGHARYSHRGPARVFERQEDAFAAVKKGKIKPNDVIVIRYALRVALVG